MHVKSRAGCPGRAREAPGRRGFKESAPGAWIVRDVCDWVESVGFGQYRKKFAHHAVDGPLLLKIDEAALKREVGIVVYGHRSRLAGEIEGLRAQRPGSRPRVAERAPSRPPRPLAFRAQQRSNTKESANRRAETEGICCDWLVGVKIRRSW